MLTRHGLICWICGIPVTDAGHLVRVNEKGTLGIWTCEKHRDRISCQIDGCTKHCKGQYPAEWICREHWRAITQQEKRTFFIARRRERKYRAIADDHPEAARFGRLCYYLWRKMVDRFNRYQALRGTMLDVEEIHRMFDLGEP